MKKYFMCPDRKRIKIKECLTLGHCRMGDRCATLPYLRMCADERPGIKVTPSSAGNGPRLIYLKGVCEEVINPADMVWMSFGIHTHDRLSVHRYAVDVLAEETLSDGQIEGIADLLSLDERPNVVGYTLDDYKTWGSYPCAKALGFGQVEEVVRDANDEPVLLKSGKNKGKPKMRKVTTHSRAIAEEELKFTTLQLNRYRILFEEYGFPISRMRVMAVPRDGNTYMARNRGIERNFYMIPITKLPDEVVLAFYKVLADEVALAVDSGKWPRLCNEEESWGGRRCSGYCTVAEFCQPKKYQPKGIWR